MHAASQTRSSLARNVLCCVVWQAAGTGNPREFDQLMAIVRQLDEIVLNLYARITFGITQTASLCITVHHSNLYTKCVRDVSNLSVRAVSSVVSLPMG